MVTLMIAYAYNDYYMRFMMTVPFLGIVLYFDKNYSRLCAHGIALPNIGIFIYRAFVANNYEGDDMLAQLGATIVVAVVMYVLLYLTNVGTRFNDDSIGKLTAESEKQEAMVAEVLEIAGVVKSGTERAMNLVDNLKTSSESVKQSVGSLNLPVSVQWGPDLLVARPFLDVTPYVGYSLVNKVTAEVLGVSAGDKGKNSFEYGLGVGAGLDVWKLQVIVRYNWNFGVLGSLKDFTDIELGDLKSDNEKFGGISVHLAFFF